MSASGLAGKAGAGVDEIGAHDETVLEAPEGVERVGPGTPCITCTYELEGLKADGSCPECGTPVAETLRQGLFSGADLDYLIRIRGGLSLVLNGLCVWLVLVIASVIANAAAQFNMISSSSGGGFVTPPWMLAVQIAGAVLILWALLAVLWGYWKFTEPDPHRGPAGTRFEPASRLVLRWATGVHAVAAVLSTASGIVSSIWSVRMLSQMGQNPSGATPVPTMSPLFLVAMIVGTLVGLAVYAAFGTAFFSSMFYVRALALRVPDMTIYRKAKSRMIACPVWATVGVLLLGIGPLIALILYWNLLNALRRRMNQIIAARLQSA